MTRPEWRLTQADFRRGRNEGIRAGADAERGVLGAPNIPANQRVDDYLPYDEAVAFVKQFPQSTIPTVAQSLRRKVAERFGLQPHQVRFYSAIGTPLDTRHGVDAFFEAYGRIVTVDVSLNNKSSTKADVFLQVQRTPDGYTIEEGAQTAAAEKIAALLHPAGGRRAA